jgi:hypothetical protein
MVMAFLDDILVLGRDFEGHLANIRAVLVRFREDHFPIQTPEHQVDDSRISGGRVT